MARYDDLDDDFGQGMAEVENVDWAATCAIYGEETEVSARDEGGFRGLVRLPISVSTVGFFRKVTSEKINKSQRGGTKQFRYFSISQTPILRIEFDYPGSTDSGSSLEYDVDEECSGPQSVDVQWELYPEEWPMEKKDSYRKWLLDKCADILSKEQMSFPVCEFCDHDALTYWDLFYKDNDDFNHRLIQLPQEMDHFHHTNVGTLIEPRETAEKEMNTLIDDNDESSGKKARKKKKWASVEEFSRQTLLNRWRYLYTDECPICFDTMTISLGVALPCGHFFCHDCLPMYFRVKVQEIKSFRSNPFLCPIEKCRQELSIAKIVKKYISDQDMDTVRKWIKDLKHPPCFSLDRCLVPSCKSIGTMRQRHANNKKNSNSKSEIFCEVCNVSRCELCLRRTTDTDKFGRIIHPIESCDSETLLKFCERYLKASDFKKKQCQEKYPWIISYANFVQHDGGALSWILENGQQCPTCRSGVERTEGCFHMQCPTCATHFCYECGEQLVPPYYGTHHCWERTELDYM